MDNLLVVTVAKVASLGTSLVVVGVGLVHIFGTSLTSFAPWASALAADITRGTHKMQHALVAFNGDCVASSLRMNSDSQDFPTTRMTRRLTFTTSCQLLLQRNPGRSRGKDDVAVDGVSAKLDELGEMVSLRERADEQDLREMIHIQGMMTTPQLAKFILLLRSRNARCS